LKQLLDTIELDREDSCYVTVYVSLGILPKTGALHTIEGVMLTSGVYLHVTFTSAKLPCKTAGWSKVNSFDNSIVEDIRFWMSMVKAKPSLKFHGQK